MLAFSKCCDCLLYQVFLSLVQGTNLIQRLINVAYTYDNLAHRWKHKILTHEDSFIVNCFIYLVFFNPSVLWLSCRVLKAQSDHRSRHEGKHIIGYISMCFYFPLIIGDVSLIFIIVDAVTHYSMWLLVSWAHCCSLVKSSLADSEHLHDWLKKLTLLIPEVNEWISWFDLSLTSILLITVTQRH